MLTFIKEQISLWEYLKTVHKPIVLYGTGDGADKILNRLQEETIPVADIYVSDEFARGQQFRGYAVKPFSSLLQVREPLIVLIAFASERRDMLSRFYALHELQETYAPHVPLFGQAEGVSAEWLQKYSSQLQEVYDRLADKKSRQVFSSVLNYKLSGKLQYLWDCTSDRKEDLANLFSFAEAELYVDLGAYDGDTVEEFLSLTAGHFSRIYAVEPDPKNFTRLQKRIQALARCIDRSDHGTGSNAIAQVENRIHCICAGIWSRPGEEMLLFGSGGRQSTLIAQGKERGSENAAESRRNKRKKEQFVRLESVDHLLQNDLAGYIKYDVEGVETEALLGSRMHLVKSSAGKLPKLLIAAYHHDEDIFNLPLLLWSLQPEYKIYLRKHPYVPAWEINLFAR